MGLSHGWNYSDFGMRDLNLCSGLFDETVLPHCRALIDDAVEKAVDAFLVSNPAANTALTE